MKAGSHTLPSALIFQVCNNACVTVRINDRGPFVRGRRIDLSSAAAQPIDLNEIRQLLALVLKMTTEDRLWRDQRLRQPPEQAAAATFALRIGHRSWEAPSADSNFN
jgi:rare lipoprotein A (peptidoglycan hydrolase)